MATSQIINLPPDAKDNLVCISSQSRSAVISRTAREALRLLDEGDEDRLGDGFDLVESNEDVKKLFQRLVTYSLESEDAIGPWGHSRQYDRERLLLWLLWHWVAVSS